MSYTHLAKLERMEIETYLELRMFIRFIEREIRFCFADTYSLKMTPVQYRSHLIAE